MLGAFRILPTTTSLVFSCAVLLLTAGLCVAAWLRSGRMLKTGALEVLRFVIVSAVLFTLNQPEWVFHEKPKEKPVVAVLWDDSGSMRTRDVINASDPAAPPMTRAEQVARLVQGTTWDRLRTTADVVIQPVSAATGTPAEQAAGGVSTNLAGPLQDLLDHHEYLRAVVLFSDGDWNEGGSPVATAMQYRLRKVPIFGACAGSPVAQPDIEVVSIDAPTFAVAGKALQVPFTIRSAMPHEVHTVISLEVEGEAALTQEIVLPPKSTSDSEFTWTPSRPGKTTLTMRIPVQDGELEPANNVRKVSLDVRQEKLRVLLIESYPRWEYRYLRNAMVRDPGVDVSCLLFHPDLENTGGGPHYIKKFPGKAELQDFDVVMLGDVGMQKGQLDEEQCRMLRGLVEQQASGLIFMPGLRGNQATLLSSELGDLYPVELDPARPKGAGSAQKGQFTLTEEGNKTLLTKLSGDPKENARIWESFPGFHWHAAALRVRAGATALAVHRTESSQYGRYPLIATRGFGAGKVLFLGTDSVWKWREGVEDLYHYRFWGQVARWMAYQRQMAAGESMRLFYAPDRPVAGSKVILNANVMDASGSPLDSGTVVATITDPTGENQVLRLKREQEGEWGLFRSQFAPERGGNYKVSLSCRETGSRLDTEIQVAARERERKGMPARPEIVEELVRVTGGKIVTEANTSDVLDSILSLPEPAPVERRFLLWSNPWWGGLVVLLMGIFWVGRKLSGRI
ncbi:MAG TPA: hypothetical protein VFE12_13060 [Acetobacteraceae bacterium]|nr:hypothetical protein [Acetobacteraceae bacterium]